MKAEKLATRKQLEYIEEMQEYSPYPLPQFIGTTSKEASEYISKYNKMAHENTWAIKNGY